MTSISSMLEMVERFNRDIIGLQIPETPTLLSFERGEFRLGHLREELREIESAMSDEDLEGIVDGCLDLAYVSLGVLVEMGVVPGATFEEVNAANMRKQRGEKSDRPGSLGFDAIKPPGWEPPDLVPYLALSRDMIQELVHSHESARVGPQHPKVLLLGYGRHGKDTVAEIMADKYHLRFTSSSLFCAEHVMMPAFRDQTDRLQYLTVQECFEDRHDHRAFWYDTIRDFNRPDATALGRAIFDEHDIYCGLRSKAEFNALKNAGVFDVAVWVDRSDTLPPEDRSSCTVEPWMADYVIDNNGPLEDLDFNVTQLMERLLS